MVTIPEGAFSGKVLDTEYHDRLIANLEGFSRVAGVPVEYVWTPVSKYCKGEAIKWLRTIRRNEFHGLCFVGPLDIIPIEDKMMSMAAACLRNYIDARVITVQDVLKYLKTDSMPVPTILLIPNFCLEKDEGGDIASWLVSALLGLLYSRLGAGLKTVIYVDSLPYLAKSYGTAFQRHLIAHYKLVYRGEC